jgi:hypothetical protein
MHDFDAALPALRAGRTVIKGRSRHSTAVYQSLIMKPEDNDALLLAEQILGSASRWRPLPDLTIVITDDVDAHSSSPEALDAARSRRYLGLGGIECDHGNSPSAARHGSTPATPRTFPSSPRLNATVTTTTTTTGGHQPWKEKPRPRAPPCTASPPNTNSTGRPSSTSLSAPLAAIPIQVG